VLVRAIWSADARAHMRAGKRMQRPSQVLHPCQHIRTRTRLGSWNNGES